MKRGISDPCGPSRRDRSTSDADTAVQWMLSNCFASTPPHYALRDPETASNIETRRPFIEVHGGVPVAALCEPRLLHSYLGREPLGLAWFRACSESTTYSSLELVYQNVLK